MEGFALIIVAGITIVSIILFVKGLEFIWTATDLYRKMVQKGDEIIKLLIEIRDNTKRDLAIPLKEGQSVSKQKICYHCGKELMEDTTACPKCGAPI